jgi:hypothetical protein
MIGGILIGFSVGVLFSILTFDLARSVRHFFKFRADGRLVNPAEVKERFGSNFKFYLLSDSVVFNAIVMPRKSDDQEDGFFPWKVFSEGFMLTTIRASETWLRKKFPDTEVIKVSLPAFD